MLPTFSSYRDSNSQVREPHFHFTAIMPMRVLDDAPLYGGDVQDIPRPELRLRMDRQCQPQPARPGVLQPVPIGAAIQPAQPPVPQPQQAQRPRQQTRRSRSPRTTAATSRPASPTTTTTCSGSSSDTTARTSKRSVRNQWANGWILTMIVDGRESSSETSKILYLTKSNLSPPLYHLCTTFVSSCRQYALLHNVYIMTYRRSLLCSRLSFYNHEFVVYRFEATTILYQKRTNIHVGLVAKFITLLKSNHSHW